MDSTVHGYGGEEKQNSKKKVYEGSIMYKK